MLKNKGRFPNNNTSKRDAHFYKLMAELKKKDMVTIEDAGFKTHRKYVLTNFGSIIASLLAKDPDCDPKYKQYAKDIDMWFD